MNEIIINTEKLTKYYGRHRGIEGLDLQVAKGEIFGFLGPNGAGKTTTIRLLIGLIFPTRGRGTVLGLDIVRDSIAIRKRVGFLPGDLALYEYMSGEEFLNYLARFHGRPDRENIRRLIDRLELDPGRKIKTLSKGNRQKLGIVQAFMFNPDLVLLDEPTAGLDPLMQQSFYTLIEEESARGRTVFLSSHVLSEVERICRRVAIIREGGLVMTQSIADLVKKRIKEMVVTFSRPVDPDALRLPGVEVVAGKGRHWRLKVRGGVNDLLQVLAARPVESLSFQDASLEDVFLEFYQGKAPNGETE